MGTWNVSFKAKGVEPASGKTGGLNIPPEGAYSAVVKDVLSEPAAKAERKGEYNTKLVISLTEKGYENAERDYFTWIPEPSPRNPKNTAAVKAAEFGAQQWVAFALSRGVTREQLDAEDEIALDLADVKDAEVYVRIVHVPSTKMKKDGTPFTNAQIDSFLTKEAYIQARTGASVSGTATTGNGKPATAGTATMAPKKGLGAVLGKRA